MNRTEKSRYPRGPTNNRTINITDYANECAPFFGNNLKTTGWHQQYSPPIWDGVRSTFILQSVGETFEEENETDWISRICPRGYIDVKVETMHELRMNKFLPDQIALGSPTPFTQTKLESWLNTYGFEAVGFELPWFFFAEEIGLELYAWMIMGMAAAFELSVRVSMYKRLLYEQEYYVTWLLEKSSEEAFKLAITYQQETWNCIHTLENAFQHMEDKTTTRESRAKQSKSDTWIIDTAINKFLRYEETNTYAKYVAQYEKNGDAAFNKLEGMRNIYAIKDKLVCIQEEIILGEHVSWNPLRGIGVIGEYFLGRNIINDSPYSYTSKKAGVEIHCENNDEMTPITYRQIMEAGLKSLKKLEDHVTGGDHMNRLLGVNKRMAYVNGDYQSSEAREFAVKTLHAQFRRKHPTTETDELLNFRDTVSGYDASAVSLDWFVEFVQRNKALLNANKVDGSNFYLLPENEIQSYSKDYLFLRSIPRQDKKTEAHFKYTAKMGLLAKKYIGTGLKLPDRVGSVNVSKSDDLEWLADLYCQDDDVGYVAIHPSLLTETITTPKSTQKYSDMIPKLSAVPTDQYVQTLLRWDSSFAALKTKDGVELCVSRTITNPMRQQDPLLFRQVQDRRLFKQSLDYLTTVEIYWLLFESTPDNLLHLIDFDVAIALGYILMRLNMGYEGSNMIRLRKDGKTVMYKTGHGEVIITDDSNRQTHKIQYQHLCGTGIMDPKSWSITRNAAVIGGLYGGTVLKNGKPAFNDDLMRHVNDYKRTVSEFQEENPLDVLIVPASWTPTHPTIVFANEQKLPNYLLPAPTMALYSACIPSLFDIPSFLKNTAANHEVELKDRERERNLVMFHGPCNVLSADGKEIKVAGKGHWPYAETGCLRGRYGAARKLRSLRRE
jgi:hypothetical protein